MRSLVKMEFKELYLAPDTPHGGLLSLSWNGGLVLGLVDVGAPFAHVPPRLLLVGRALNFIQSTLAHLKQIVESPESGGEQCSRAGSSGLSCSR